ncbi:helix-turn-helix domain-containing protein [Priestia flexa]|uniref:helix-turn-helix domain-containing protein n=1 Tax=Priestia flexa TaxID=86664 RepID=UPI002491B379|nr:helix-turn-helix transcriptional regulator [Priestia flexa]
MGVSYLSSWRKKCEDSEKEKRIRFGQKVRELRKEAGYSRQEFCELTNVSYEALERIESGHVDPNTPNLETKIQKGLTKSYMVITI